MGEPKPYEIAQSSLSPVEEAVRVAELRGMSPAHLRSAAAARNRDADRARMQGREADALFLEGIRDALAADPRSPSSWLGLPAWHGMTYAAGYAIAACQLTA